MSTYPCIIFQGAATAASAEVAAKHTQSSECVAGYLETHLIYLPGEERPVHMDVHVDEQGRRHRVYVPRHSKCHTAEVFEIFAKAVGVDGDSEFGLEFDTWNISTTSPTPVLNLCGAHGCPADEVNADDDAIMHRITVTDGFGKLLTFDVHAHVEYVSDYKFWATHICGKCMNPEFEGIAACLGTWRTLGLDNGIVVCTDNHPRGWQ